MAPNRKASKLFLLTLLTAGSLAAQKPLDETRQSCLGTDPDAPIVIEVFSDHQCPACRRFYLEVTRPILADYAMQGKACVVYHEFPLKQHQYARQAARYTQAARRLGQQDWIRVTDALYLYQSQWSANGEVESVVARALGKAKMEEVRKELDNPKIEAAIEREIALGQQHGVRSTPTILITADGKTERIPPGVQYSILRRYLDSLLASVR